MMWLILQVHSMPKRKLNYHDQFNKVQSTTKSRQDNDLNDYTSAVYVEIKIDLS